MSEKRPMADILNAAGMEARQTKYGGHQAVFINPSVNIVSACNLLKEQGYKIQVSYGHSWPLLRDATLKYNAFGQVMK